MIAVHSDLPRNGGLAMTCCMNSARVACSRIAACLIAVAFGATLAGVSRGESKSSTSASQVAGHLVQQAIDAE